MSMKNKHAANNKNIRVSIKQNCQNFMIWYDEKKLLEDLEETLCKLI
jgi:hypothetical protein